MDIMDDIMEIRKRTFDDAFFERIFKLYQKEAHEEGSGVSEKEYDAAREALPRLLPRKQLAYLCEAEDICFEVARWLAEFAFTRGVYAGFQQHFVHTASAGQFKALVIESALQMPGMQCYPVYCSRRGKANECFVRSRKRVTPAASNHVVEMELAWQNRFLGVCRYAFPQGYRFAFSLIGEAASDRVFVWDHE